jgi:NADH-quinone oxidoreductase subunit L
VPLLSGFFSKDEILYKTFVGTEVTHYHGYPVLWLIGAITSLLTAVYMFRLVILTFHGRRRTPAPHAGRPAEEEAAAQASSHAHAHGSHGHAPHEAPPSMAVPLIVLAIGSIVAGYVGIPHALGGSNWIERYLHPSFEVSATAHAGAPGGTPVAQASRPARAPGGTSVAQAFRPARAPGEAIQTTPPLATGTVGTAGSQAAQETTHVADVGLERLLMAISSGIAVIGIVIAIVFWLKRPDIPGAATERLGAAYRLLLNKYYVDEMYDAVVVQPIKRISTNVLWKGGDAGAIDGTVNGVGAVVTGGSSSLRRLQTGSIRTYAAALLLGVVGIMGWYLWK